jgi:hypothetical protein
VREKYIVRRQSSVTYIEWTKAKRTVLLKSKFERLSNTELSIPIAWRKRLSSLKNGVEVPRVALDLADILGRSIMKTVFFHD